MSTILKGDHGLRRWLAAGAAISALCVGEPVLAQDNDTDDAADERITVTGSRVARSDFASENPITVISGDEFRNSGLPNIGEALRNQLATGSGGFSESSILSGGGASSVDLRNFGTRSVLVLVNGRRVATFTDALTNPATDLGLIPVAAIERVEILRDGASTTYGADAVSGVINIILKDDFEGLELSGFQGISSQGDAEQTQVAMVLGGQFDRGSAWLSAEYRFQDNLRQTERDWAIPTITSLTSTGFNNGSFFSPGGFAFDAVTGQSLWCTRPKAFGGDEITNVVNTPACLSQQSQSAVGREAPPARYDYALEQDLVADQQFFTATAYGTYNLTDWAEASIDFQVATRSTIFRLDGNPGFFNIAANNPHNPFGVLLTSAIRPSSTVGTRQTGIEADLYRVVPAIRFDLDALTDGILPNFEFEVSYLWSKLNSILEGQGRYNLVRLQRISDPVACAADALCAQAVSNSPGGALDALRPGNWTEREIDYFRQVATSVSSFETNNWQFVLTGEPVELPAGPVGLALGYEFREEFGFNNPDSVTVSGESISNLNFRTRGQFDTTEIFGELNIPVINDVPFIQELTVNLQGRWFDFSQFDDDTVWKLSANWVVSEDLRIRASKGTSYRAPAIDELFGGGTTSFDFVSDPCNNYGLLDPNVGNNANIIANCTADGLAPNFVQNTQQYEVFRGGNPNLVPEEGKSLSVGAIITPRWVPGLQIAIDYFDLELANLIGPSATTDVRFNLCYTQTPAQRAADPFCQNFTRSVGTGTPIGLQNPDTNNPLSGATDGIDFALIYQFDWANLIGRHIGVGEESNPTVTLDWRATKSFSYTFNPGLGRITSRGNIGITDLAMNATAIVDYGDFGFQWRLRYIDDLQDDRFDGNNAFNYDGPPSHIEHDVLAQYALGNYDFVVGVNNIFGEDPPYVFNIGNNTADNTYGTAIRGRYIFGRVNAEF